jgi:type VI secretion system protein ImpA
VQTPGQGPDLDPLIKFLKQANTKLANALGDPVGDTGGAGDDEDGPATAFVPSGGAMAGAAIGAINTPTDVKNALDRIIGYYERAEPSSPLPLLLLRAKKLVGADFMTIVRDMAPDGVDRVNLLGGLEDDD